MIFKSNVAKYSVKTAAITLCAAVVIYVVRRPNHYFTLDNLGEAAFENLKAILLIAPAYIAYTGTRVFLKSPIDPKAIAEVPPALRYVRIAVIILLACAFVSLFSEHYCDEDSGDCSERPDPARNMMNFLRVSMAALAGLILAIVKRNEGQ